jgi:uncharacterized protein
MVNLLTLLDDIAATLDDVAMMTKIAVRKTSVLMSDDLAVNAGVVVGVSASRELPIVWSIFLGSLINKVICIVGAFAILALYPPILNYVLILGGAYLSYEGAHKVIEKLFHKVKEKTKVAVSEELKIKGAVRTDLILSIEIIVIAKESISGTLLEQLLSLSFVGIAASIIIYGMVAIIVKIDDFGLYLIKKEFKRIGSVLVGSMPYIMKTLGIVGTIAMFLVGGGILTHSFHIPLVTVELLQNLVTGVVFGSLLVGLGALVSKVRRSIAA